MAEKEEKTELLKFEEFSNLYNKKIETEKKLKDAEKELAEFQSQTADGYASKNAGQEPKRPLAPYVAFPWGVILFGAILAILAVGTIVAIISICKNGDDANCVNMQVTNGGSIDVAPYLYGGYVEVNFTPLSNLIKIPEELDPTMVSIFACPGPTAMHAFALAEQAGVDFKKVNTAVVQGLGPVGTYAVMYLKSIGIKKVFAITAGNNTQREELAKKLGANEVFNLTRNSVEEINHAIIKESKDNLGVDLVFEASGAPAAVPQGMELLRNRGVYLVPGQYSNSGGITIQPQMITFKALHIIGSSQYSVKDVKAYLEFLCNHKELHECVKKLGNYYPISQVNKAFDDAKAGNNVKTILVK